MWRSSCAPQSLFHRTRWEVKGHIIQLSMQIHKSISLSVLQLTPTSVMYSLLWAQRSVFPWKSGNRFSLHFPFVVHTHTPTHINTHTHTLVPSPWDTLLRYRNPVCHLIKWPTQTDGFVQTACNTLKAENEQSALQTRNMKANLPPNKQKETYKYWIALSAQDHPRELKKQNKGATRRRKRRKSEREKCVKPFWTGREGKNNPGFCLFRIF